MKIVLTMIFAFFLTLPVRAAVKKCHGAVLMDGSKKLNKSKKRCVFQSYKPWKETLKHFRRYYPSSNYVWRRIGEERKIKIRRIEPKKHTSSPWEGITVIFSGGNTKYFIYLKGYLKGQ